MTLLSFFKRAPESKSTVQPAKPAVRAVALPSRADSEVARRGPLRQQILATALRDTLMRFDLGPGAIEVGIAPGAVGKPRASIIFSMTMLDSKAMEQYFWIQQTFDKRLLLLDPTARSWRTGYFWTFRIPQSTATAFEGAFQSPVEPPARPVQAVAHPTAGPETLEAEPQQVQLDRLRELLASGDRFHSRRVSASHSTDFENTRPFGEG